MSPEEEKPRKQRQPRTDTGPRLNKRDRAALKWIAQQYAISLDHLCMLLARLIEPGKYKQSPKVPGRITEKRAMVIINRWEELGLIEKKWIIHGDPPWIWLSPEGLRFVSNELGELRPYAPTPGKLSHLYNVNVARLYVESRRQDAVWTGEREIRSTQKVTAGKKIHTPDATVLTNQRLIAIEIELTTKTYNRLEKILLELASNTAYYTIWYFCKPRAATIVRYSIGKMGEAHRNKFVVYDLEEMRKQHAANTTTTKK